MSFDGGVPGTGPHTQPTAASGGAGHDTPADPGTTASPATTRLTQRIDAYIMWRVLMTIALVVAALLVIFVL